MTNEDIVQVVRREPQLTSFGFDDRKESFERNRRDLLNAWYKCTLACDWLSGLERTKTVNRDRTSYSLKHTCERALGKVANGYISNGELICAAIYMGFKYEKVGHNAFLNISKKSVPAYMEGVQPMTTWGKPFQKSEIEKMFALIGEYEVMDCLDNAVLLNRGQKLSSPQWASWFVQEFQRKYDSTPSYNTITRAIWLIKHVGFAL